MKIKNSFTIDATVDEAWQLLTDIPAIAPCLPGAKLTDEEDGVYSGAVKIKVGPVTAEYRGAAEFVERDDINHRAVIDGKGRDSRGAGIAQALITAEMHDLDGRTVVDITTDLKVTGKVAQFGRGVMQDVSEKLLGQFADCLATKLDGTEALESVASTSAADDAEEVRLGDEDDSALSAGSAANRSDDDDDALDLFGVAGGAVAKRAIPIVLSIVVLIVVLVLVLA
jgi:carbon monoxide dehydrogenase subunit G